MRRYGLLTSIGWLVTVTALLGGAAVVFYASGDLARSRLDRMLLLAPWALGLYWIVLGAWRRTRWGRPAPSEMLVPARPSSVNDRRDAWLTVGLLVGLGAAVAALWALT